jgi:FMN-dependent NADH-azoreductase
MKLLHIDSSIQGDASASRELTREIVRSWQDSHPGATTVYRDLVTQPLAHLTAAALTGTDQVEAARSASILQEFLDADVVVIGVPLYNFSIPSQLKAWVDRISVAGKTFRYTERGPQGLSGGKQVILAVTRGGLYTAGGVPEFAESYLKFLLGFLGVTEVSVVRAEGLSHLNGGREAGLAAARAAIPAARALAA